MTGITSGRTRFETTWGELDDHHPAQPRCLEAQFIGKQRVNSRSKESDRCSMRKNSCLVVIGQIIADITGANGTYPPPLPLSYLTKFGSSLQQIKVSLVSVVQVMKALDWWTSPRHRLLNLCVIAATIRWITQVRIQYCGKSRRVILFHCSGTRIVKLWTDVLSGMLIEIKIEFLT